MVASSRKAIERSERRKMRFLMFFVSLSSQNRIQELARI